MFPENHHSEPTRYSFVYSRWFMTALNKHNNDTLFDYCSTYLPTYLPTYHTTCLHIPQEHNFHIRYSENHMYVSPRNVFFYRMGISRWK